MLNVQLYTDEPLSLLNVIYHSIKDLNQIV